MNATRQMTLQQYIKALGETNTSFLSTIGIKGTIMKTIEKGEPIAATYAQRIADKLSQEFGRTITIADISDIKTV